MAEGAGREQHRRRLLADMAIADDRVARFQLAFANSAVSSSDDLTFQVVCEDRLNGTLWAPAMWPVARRSRAVRLLDTIEEHRRPSVHDCEIGAPRYEPERNPRRPRAGGSSAAPAYRPAPVPHQP